MKNIDPVYLLKLLQASELFTSLQKQIIKEKFSQLSDLELAELIQILEQEKQINVNYIKKLGRIEKEMAHKKIKFIYKYAEKKVVMQEKNELAKLEEELNTF